MGTGLQALSGTAVDEEIASSNVPVLVELGAEWCPPCRAMEPVLEALAKEYGDRLRIVTVDADEEPELVLRFGVRGLPTFLVFRDGQLAERLVGARSMPRLVGELAGVLT